MISDSKSYFKSAHCLWLRFTGFCVREINSKDFAYLDFHNDKNLSGYLFFFFFR